MSRIGNKLILLPAGVTLTVEGQNNVVVKGPKGELAYQFNANMGIEVNGTEVKVTRPDDSIANKTIHGTTRALLNNMVTGVSQGYEKTLLIEGVGYRASLKGKTLVVAAGFSHLVEMAIPEGLTVVCPSQTEIKISGIDKQKVGQFAAEVREKRPPEPYKGKGIKYVDEVIRRKEGKTGKK